LFEITVDTRRPSPKSCNNQLSQLLTLAASAANLQREFPVRL
jgi:hypothetical protein